MLAISPCAVEDLSASLASLEHLAEVIIQQACAEPEPRLRAEEVAAFVEVAPRLAKLTISWAVCGWWPPGSKPLVERAAEGRGVKMWWCDVVL